jgi:hypothetical protein
VNKIGFKEAPITVGMGVGIMNKDFRDCNRVMIYDTRTADFILQYLLKCIPLCYEGNFCI